MMASETDGKAGQARGGGRFATTKWSVVLAAGDRGSSGSRAALSELCETYWYPLYAFARRRGLSAEAAQDSTQGFFVRFLEKDTLRHVQPEKGRFRSFLLTSFKNFLSDERAHAQRKKRGGGAVQISIDLKTAEGRYRNEPADEQTPERIFERRWALTLLEKALGRLRADHVSSNREKVFDKLKGYLTGEKGSVPYARTARDLGISEIAVKVAVHRLRRRFRGCLLEEISQTLSDEADLGREVRHLMSVLEAG